MKLVVLGVSLSSSWGNGHATTFRALLSAFAERGHDVLFLERERPWYAAHRDLPDPAFCRLAYYDSLAELERWRPDIEQADAVMLGSYVPDGSEVGRFVQRHAKGVACFYDIDTPITLAKLASETCDYLDPALVPGFDIYFSFTGGPTLERLEREFGSPCACALYCAADTGRYRPIDIPVKWDLSYLGTYSADRQPTLERLLIEPARACPARRLVVAGPEYPGTIEWPANVERIAHLPPGDHPEFYSASRYTLNVTRADMIDAGWSPSVRLFEAGACGTAVISDRWDGIEDFFRPDREILLADSAADVAKAFDRDPRAIGEAARAIVLADHSAQVRAAQLEADLHASGGGIETATARELIA